MGTGQSGQTREGIRRGRRWRRRRGRRWRRRTKADESLSVKYEIRTSLLSVSEESY
jgi:hypothetical protein